MVTVNERMCYYDLLGLITPGSLVRWSVYQHYPVLIIGTRNCPGALQVKFIDEWGIHDEKIVGALEVLDANVEPIGNTIISSERLR